MLQIDFNKNWFFGRDMNMMFCMAESQTPITLPHDAMILEPRNAENPSQNPGGFFPGGNYVYTKQFTVSKEYQNSKIILRFEGIYGHAMIYVNGEFVCSNFYGYKEFYADLTPHLLFESENTIQVRVLNSGQPGSRWYSGSGIYRPVTMLIGNDVHVSEDGIRITTQEQHKNVASVDIEVPLRFLGKTSRTIRLSFRIAPDNKSDDSTAVCADMPVTLYPGDIIRVQQRIYIKNPKLWSVDTPNMYFCEVNVLDITSDKQDSVVLDTLSDQFGIRYLHADPINGLQINGEKVHLRGACIHHDNGILGAAEFKGAAKRRVMQLKAAGFNAIRMSHHPASRAIIEACDQVGVLVMDEMYDAWHTSKVTFDHAHLFEQTWEQEVETVVKKDFNHPSVIIYSIGNEIQEIGTREGARTARKLADKFHSLDGTRFVTNAINGLLTVMGQLDTIVKDLKLDFCDSGEEAQGDVNDLMTVAMGHAGEMVKHPLVGEKLEESFSSLDICGYNYMTSRYPVDATDYPNRLIVGTETYTPQIAENWRYVKKIPAVLGDFTWTGYDYIGEAGIGMPGYDSPGGFQTPYPCYLANVGDIDILGYRRPSSYYREIVWGLRSIPYLAVQPPCHYSDEPSLTPWITDECESSWTWNGYEGKPCRVEVYSDAEEVELFINGCSMGRQPAGEQQEFKTIFDTIYTPGVVEVIAYNRGKESGRYHVDTAKKELSLCMQADKNTLEAGEEDIAYITISLRDAKGVLDMENGAKVLITVSGEGTLQGFGSADPVSQENFYDKERTTYRGMVLAAIRSGGSVGKIVVKAEAEGFEPRKIILEVK